MTRHGKCDFCRKLKVKCDELLPSCSGCVKRGRECTHTSLKNKPFRFVEVQGEIVDDTKKEWHCQGRKSGHGAPVESKKRTVIKTLRRPECSALQQLSTPNDDFLAMHSVALLFKQPEREETRIAARWTHFTSKGCLGSHPLDSFGAWSTFVPRYIGHSELVAKAASCLAEATMAHAIKTEESYVSLRSTYADAIVAVRKSLDDRSQRYSGSVLLAVIILYYTEIIVSTRPNAFMHHALGLANLFKKCYKTRDESDDEQELVASIFHSVCFSSFPAAIFKQTDHDLDQPEYFSIPVPQFQLGGLSEATVAEALGYLRRTCVLLPRLTRWTRQVRTGAADADLAERAAELAISLYAENLDQTAVQEALDKGVLRVEPTTHPLVLPATPTSYTFASPGVCTLLAPYWGIRAIVCGLVLTLHDAFAAAAAAAASNTTTGTASTALISLVDRRAVEEEDIRCADHVARCAQAALAEGAGAVGREQIRVLMPLQMAFGTWHRAERRAAAAGPEGEAWYEVERARFMKRWCLDRANEILRKWRRGDTDYHDMELGSEFWAGEKAFEIQI